jgi:hypothetical protein
MPRRFKVGDRIEGKIAEVRNFSGLIIEIVLLRGANRIVVRWDNGLQGNYSARALQFPADPAFGGAPQILPPNALAGVNAGVAERHPNRRNLIAHNGEYDDSSPESNYGSRLERIWRFWRNLRNSTFTMKN